MAEIDSAYNCCPVKVLWESGKEKATVEENSLSRVCQKTCWRLHGQVEESSLIWWEQNGAFLLSDKALFYDPTHPTKDTAKWFAAKSKPRH